MSVVGMTNSIKSQSLLSKSRTCFKVVCQNAHSSCLCCHCAFLCLWVSEMSTPVHTGLRLTDSEPVACPQYQNKSSISCFVNPRLWPPCSGDCQVTFRKPSLSLFLSVCHAKASLLPFFFLLRPFPLLRKNKFIVIRDAVPRLNGFCLK